MDQKYRNISLPEELYTAIEKRIQGTEINSVEEYVIFALEETLSYEENHEESFTKEEEEEIKNKLKALGYLG